MRLLLGQVEVLAGLALQLGAHEGQRVRGNLPAAATERPEGQQLQRRRRRVALLRVLQQVLPLQSLQGEGSNSRGTSIGQKSVHLSNTLVHSSLYEPTAQNFTGPSPSSDHHPM